LNAELLLSLACLLQAVVIAVLAGCVPYLWWRVRSQARQVGANSRRLKALRRDVAKLDEVLDGVMQAADGVLPHQPRRPRGVGPMSELPPVGGGAPPYGGNGMS
jgi:hypothetical protein